MTRTVLRSMLAALACAGALAMATPSMAKMVKMKAELKASNEVPPTQSNGAGTVDVTYNTSSKMLSWKGSYSGLTGPAIAAHFHAGEMGKNGGVVLTDAQAAQLMSGGWYVNIHTNANKAGEIRGQVEK